MKKWIKKLTIEFKIHTINSNQCSKVCNKSLKLSNKILNLALECLLVDMKYNFVWEPENFLK